MNRNAKFRKNIPAGGSGILFNFVHDLWCQHSSSKHGKQRYSHESNVLIATTALLITRITRIFVTAWRIFFLSSTYLPATRRHIHQRFSRPYNLCAVAWHHINAMSYLDNSAGTAESMVESLLSIAHWFTIQGCCRTSDALLFMTKIHTTPTERHTHQWWNQNIGQ